MSEISVTVVGSTTINPTVGNGDTVNVTIASTGERGPKGDVGAAGPANTLTIGTVSQGTAAATITGTSPNQVLNLVLQKGDAGTPATNIELQATGTHLQWRLVGASTWTNLVALSAITGPTGSTGAAGAAVELQASGTHIQWRYVGGSTWTNVVALSSLVGATGATGATGPQGPAGPPINLADETPQPLGVASAGTALAAARADHVHAVGSITYSSLSGVPSTFAPSAHTHAVSDVTGLQTALDGKQAAGTYATLVGGTIPSSQLPSYVDDVIDVGGTLPATGDVGKIYVVSSGASTNKIYRWSGSTFVEISPSPGSTDSVTEGSVNLYHTAARAAAAAPVQSVAGRTGTITLAQLGSSGTASETTFLRGDGVWSAAGSTDASALTSGTVPAARLPLATTTTAGAVIVGSGLAIASGVLSATGGGGSANIVEAATAAGFPGTGAANTLYIATDVSRAYRWSGSVYVEVGPSGGGGGSGVVVAASAASFPATGASNTLYVSTTARTISYWSGSEYITLGVSVLAAPTGLTAAAGNAQVMLTWTPPAGTITSYRVQLSLDGVNWTTLESDATAVEGNFYLVDNEVTNGTAYVFRVAAVNGAGVGTYTSASSSVTPTGAVFRAIPTMTSLTSPSGVVSGESNISAGSDTGNELWRAFDGNSSTAAQFQRGPSNSPSRMIQYAFPDGQKSNITGYSITTPQPGFVDYFSQWLMYGSDDLSTWTEIDSRSGISGWSNQQAKTFTLSQQRNFRAYRWVFQTTTDNSGPNQISTLQLTE